MNDKRLAGLPDDGLDRDIARALAVDPSPEFLARVRTRIANEPAPGMWRSASALRSWPLAACFAGGAVVALAILAVVMMRPDDRPSPAGDPPLASRAIGFEPALLPYVASTFRRTSEGPAEAGPHVQGGSAAARTPDLAPLLDPRETAALRSLIAGVRDKRVDLAPLLQPGAPAPMELPPVDNLVIAPIAIEPLAPQGGAQGERQ